VANLHAYTLKKGLNHGSQQCHLTQRRETSIATSYLAVCIGRAQLPE